MRSGYIFYKIKREIRVFDLKCGVNEPISESGQPPRHPSADFQDEKDK
jgi:hypothetical protein